MKNETSPTEKELDQMIAEVEEKLFSEMNKIGYDLLHDELKELRKQRQQLIIQNNAL